MSGFHGYHGVIQKRTNEKMTGYQEKKKSQEKMLMKRLGRHKGAILLTLYFSPSCDIEQSAWYHTWLPHKTDEVETII